MSISCPSLQLLPSPHAELPPPSLHNQLGIGNQDAVKNKTQVSKHHYKMAALRIWDQAQDYKECI